MHLREDTKNAGAIRNVLIGDLWLHSLQGPGKGAFPAFYHNVLLQSDFLFLVIYEFVFLFYSSIIETILILNPKAQGRDCKRQCWMVKKAR